MAMTQPSPRKPLMVMEANMLRGMTEEACWISSAMWDAASQPKGYHDHVRKLGRRVDERRKDFSSFAYRRKQTL